MLQKYADQEMPMFLFTTTRGWELIPNFLLGGNDLRERFEMSGYRSRIITLGDVDSTFSVDVREGDGTQQGSRYVAEVSFSGASCQLVALPALPDLVEFLRAIEPVVRMCEADDEATDRAMGLDQYLRAPRGGFAGKGGYHHGGS